MPSVTFLPLGLRVDGAAGETVFDLGRRAGVPIATSCVGRASCGLCRVKVISGEEHLSAPNAAERKHLGNVYFLTRVRLACQTMLGDGEAVVELPELRELPER